MPSPLGSDTPPAGTTPPPPSGGGQRRTPPKPKTSSGRTKWDILETKLVEVINTGAMAQTTAGVLLGDPRHGAGGEVTAKFAPDLASAYVGLAKENAAVERILTGLVEGSAVGAALFMTLGFAFTQAQVYGVAPASIPNPYLGDIEIPVPPSDEVRAATYAPPAAYRDDLPFIPTEDAAGASSPDVAPGSTPGGSGVTPPDEDQLTAAQQQAEQVAEARKNRSSGVDVE